MDPERLSENGIQIGDPDRESTRIHQKDSNAGASSSIGDISEIKDSNTHISLSFNFTDNSGSYIEEEDSYKQLHIQSTILRERGGKSVTSDLCHQMGRLNVDRDTKSKSIGSEVLVNCTDVYTTALCGTEDISPDSVFHSICESSEEDSKNGDHTSETVPESDPSDGSCSENEECRNNDCRSVGRPVEKGVNSDDDSEKEHTSTCSDDSSVVEVQDMSLQTSMHHELCENNKKMKSLSSDSSYYEVKDVSLQACESILTTSQCEKTIEDFHGNEKNSEIKRRIPSSDSSYLEVQDASLQTSQHSIDTVPDNSSENDSFDKNLYESVAMPSYNENEFLNEEKQNSDIERVNNEMQDDETRYFDLPDTEEVPSNSSDSSSSAEEKRGDMNGRTKDYVDGTVDLVSDNEFVPLRKRLLAKKHETSDSQMVN